MMLQLTVLWKRFSIIASKFGLLRGSGSCLHKSILEFEFKSGNKAVRDEIFRAIIKLLEAISRVVNGLELARNSQADNGCGSPMLGTKSIHPGFKGMDLLGCKIF